MFFFLSTLHLTCSISSDAIFVARIIITNFIIDTSHLHGGFFYFFMLVVEMVKKERESRKNSSDKSSKILNHMCQLYRCKWHVVCMVLIKIEAATPHNIHRNELLSCKAKECDDNQRGR